MQKDNTHPKVVNFSLDILDTYLANNGCRFYKQEESQKEICFVLNNEQQQHSILGSHERTVPVVLLNNGYWLYCGFDFYKRKNNRKDLKHFALHFFFADSKPLFRAEWACLDIPESKKHAQPHWHLDSMINASCGKIVCDQMQSFDVFQKQRGAEHLLSVNLGRAHFFMNWNLEKEKDSEAPYLDFRDEGVFRQWFTVTMKYVDAELRALIKR